jgi:capsular exopolysaccharide synthesis family protein
MEMRQYLILIKRWIWLILLVTVLGIGAGYIYSLYEKPVYRAQSMILVLQNQDNSTPDTLFANNKQAALTLSQLVITQPVIEATSKKLGYPVSSKQIQVENVPTSDLIQITVEDNDASRAAAIANTLVTEFVEQNKAVQSTRFASSEESLQAQIQDVDAKIANLQTQMKQQSEDIYKQQIDDVSKTIANLQNEISTLQQDVVQLDYIVNPPALRVPNRISNAPTPTVEQQLELTQKQDRLTELKNLLQMYQKIYVDLTYNPSNVNGPTQNLNIDQIQATLTQYQEIYSNLVANLESVRLARMRSSTNIVQVETAGAPRVPVRPNPIANMAIGGILGLLLSGGFAFVNEYMDDTLRSPEEVAQILQLPVLGYIGDMKTPQLGSGKNSTVPYVLAAPRSPVSEAFRSLRANLEFVDLDRPIQTLLVTSSTLSEGKTTIATNLAIVMSQLGRKVILVDADLRRPRVHRALGISNVMGLSDVLRNHASINEVAQSWSNENLEVITSGSLPPNPAEILGSARMVQVLNELKTMADMVVIDSPPSLLADASVLAARADGVLLVIQSDKTQMNAAMAMIDQLKRVGAHVVGVALNRINTRNSYYYYEDLKKYTNYAYDVEKTQPKVSNKSSSKTKQRL